MGEVSTFVKDNRAILGRNIKGLNRVAKVLVKQRGALDEILSTAPLALNNLYLTYNPQAGTLDTRSNQGEVEGQIAERPGGVPLRHRRAGRPSARNCEQAEFPALRRRVPRAAWLRPGRREPGRTRFDPTLGGLVEVQR